MGARETINKNPAIVVGGFAITVLIAVAVMYLQSRKPAIQTRGYFSIDDGNSWFADDIDKNPPYLVNGKEAVKAWVISCNGKTYVSVLEKYSPSYKQSMDRSVAEKKAGKAGPAPMDNPSNHLFKKPGDKAWLTGFDSGPLLSQATQCSDGSNAEMVNP